MTILSDHNSRFLDFKQEAGGSNILTPNISDVFFKLKKTNFEILKTNLPYLDDRRLFIRGTVTRLGAFSNVGKSAMAYFLAHNLLLSGHRGVIFSTEVSSPIVLANMLKIKNHWHFWDIMNHKVNMEEYDATIKGYYKLSIFDSQDTQNKLAEMEQYIKYTMPDFVIIDYAQGVTPKAEGFGSFEKLTNYAFEVQMMAQQYNCSIIDLSQISNADSKGLKSKKGRDRINEINFKGSGDLFSSADIALVLDRYRPFENDEDEEGVDTLEMRIGVRKHKYLPAGDYFTLLCDFEYGTFKLKGAPEEGKLPF